MSCEFLQGCPFYNDKMDIQSAIGRLYKKRYCEGNKKECARYIVVTQKGAEYVPSNLFPNMMDRANEILEKE